MRFFSISADPIQAERHADSLSDPAAGAVVTFDGRVRNHNEGRAVASLEYEAYAVLAEKEGSRIVEEALAMFPVTRAICVHRTGHLAIGDVAVWVGVSAPHRDEAFRACRYIIDEIKHRVPIWKKEHHTDGTAEWVLCSHPRVHAAGPDRQHGAVHSHK